MSYEKQTWAKGDIVTSAKLNHMEDGIAGGSGVLVVGIVYDEQADTTTLDKTWQEIHDATFSVIITDNPMMGKLYNYISTVAKKMGNSNHTVGTKDNYGVTAVSLTGGKVESSIYVCNSADDYPVLHTD